MFFRVIVLLNRFQYTFEHKSTVHVNRAPSCSIFECEMKSQPTLHEANFLGSGPLRL